MKKSAQIKFAKAINGATDQVYAEAFLKRAAERGIPCSTKDDFQNLLKTAAALRAVSEAVGPAIKEANSKFIATALDSLLSVKL